MTDQPSPKRRWRWLGWSLLALALAAVAWLGWRAYDERAAIREAEAAGWQWDQRDPFTNSLAEWREGWETGTWRERYRRVYLAEGASLASARPLIGRLRPTYLFAFRCPDANPDAIRGLSSLQILDFRHSIGLQNMDALRWLPTLRHLDLEGCTGLQNVDGVRWLSALRSLDLDDCTGLRHVDALRGLSALESLDLKGCTGLQNVNGLRDLPALQYLDLTGCTALSASALWELRAALPQPRITFPNGSYQPPP